MDTKICNQCHQVLPETQFKIQVTNGKEYRLRSCRACQKVYFQERAKKLKEREVIFVPEMKVCSVCTESLSASQFTKHRSQKDGLSSWCKNCARRLQKERSERLVKTHVLK